MSLLNTPQTDPRDQRFIDMIKEHGHAIQYVASAEDDKWEPPFAYSVGGTESYGAPELIISGLGFDVSKAVINHFMYEWKSGQRFLQMLEYQDFLEGFPVIFMTASAAAKKEFACSTDWYYEREDFDLWQVVWPGAGHGLFPWQVDDQLADVQKRFVDGGWPRIH
jgi:Domain of unknown function (DUF4262)